MVVLGLATYGALFGFVGARLRRPIVAGLVFAFGWEQAVQLLPGYVKRATVVYYLQALVPHAMPNDSVVSGLIQLLSDAPSPGTSVVALLTITGVMLWLGSRCVQKREYVLDQ
jgi:hypothetical protein